MTRRCSTSCASRRRWRRCRSSSATCPSPSSPPSTGPPSAAASGSALAADVRLCAQSASFGNGAILVGLTGAEMGMSYYLPSGRRAERGRRLDAHRPQGDLAGGLRARPRLRAASRTSSWARAPLQLPRTIAASSALATQLTKRALQQNADAPDLASALEVENRNQVIAHGSDEAAAARQRWAEQ